ncbi:MAG: hypothetical protein AAF329_27910, partial [Cyanobacteria bacterium P01_A01_bin.17]
MTILNKLVSCKLLASLILGSIIQPGLANDSSADKLRPTFRPLNCHTQILSLEALSSRTFNAHIVQKNYFTFILNSS